MSGRIFSFYSWKGGVGRTMALANVAVQLARRGKRVLLVDWDLEAPGLDRYFRPADWATSSQLSITPPEDPTGLLGLLSDLANSESKNFNAETWRRRCTQIALRPSTRKARQSSSISAPQRLQLLDSGLGSPDYATRLQAFSWGSFFAENDGGQVIEALRDQWREAYDIVLIDSRTGLTDSGGVCTVQIPDLLVFVFTANTQSLEDGIAFLDGVQRARADFAYERAPLTVIPLLARWEGDKEVDLADEWLERIASVIARMVDTWLPKDLPVRRMLERLRVPHVARFSFGEPLPVLTHSLSDPDRPGLAYDLLAELLASGFSGAGEIIDPDYRSAFDPADATDADFDRLTLDDQMRESELARVVDANGSNSSETIGFLIRLAESGLRLGKVNIADQLMQSAVSKLRRRTEAEPHDAHDLNMLSEMLTSQGNIKLAGGNKADALLTYRESLALRQRLVDGDAANTEQHRAWGVNYSKAGDALRYRGDLAGALAMYRESLAILEKVAIAAPSNLLLQQNMSAIHDRVGDTLRNQGDLDAALMAYRKSLSASERLTQAQPSNELLQRELSVSQEKIGDVLRDKGDLGSALTIYKESLAIRKRLIEINPSDNDWSRDLSVGLNKLGDVLREQSDENAALATYREALALRKRLVEADPTNSAWQHDVAVSQDKVGEALRNLGDLDGARLRFQEALAISRRLVEADPSNAMWQRDLSVSQEKIGNMLCAQGDLAGALTVFRESLALRKRLTEADPSNILWQYDLSTSQERIGEVLWEQGDFVEALMAFDEALALKRRLIDIVPTNARFQHGLSVALTRVVLCLEQQGNSTAALTLAQESLSIDEMLYALDPSNTVWMRDVFTSREIVKRLKAAENQAGM